MSSVARIELNRRDQPELQLGDLSLLRRILTAFFRPVRVRRHVMAST